MPATSASFTGRNPLLRRSARSQSDITGFAPVSKAHAVGTHFDERNVLGDLLAGLHENRSALGDTEQRVSSAVLFREHPDQARIALEGG